MAENMTPPTEFVPTGGQASGFRQALRKYAAGRGYQGQALPSMATDATFGKSYLSDPNAGRDMSDADRAYLQATGGDVTGLLGQYQPENPSVTAQRQAQQAQAAEQARDSERLRRINAVFGETLQATQPIQQGQNWWDKPGYFTVPKAIAQQTGGFAKAVGQNWNKVF